jgi:membrane-associated protease RseP (regulator of RpoE activity)
MSRLFFSIVGLSLCLGSGLQAQQRGFQMENRAVASASSHGARATAHSSSDSSHVPVGAAPVHVSDWTADMPSAQQAALRIAREQQWGVTSMAIPSYLKHAGLGLGSGQGVLVTSVMPGSAAAMAGLQVGESIVEIDSQPWEASQPLPTLRDIPHSLLVLGSEGLREVPISHGWVPEPAFGSADELLLNALDFTGIIPPQFAGQFGGIGAAAMLSPVRSLAVSEADGLLHVSAVVVCDGVEQRVELRGTRGQVLRQLRTLSVEIQHALAPQLGF